MSVTAQRIRDTEVEALPHRTVVTDGVAQVVRVQQAFNRKRRRDTVLIERIGQCERVHRHVRYPAQTHSSPGASQADVGLCRPHHTLVLTQHGADFFIPTVVTRQFAAVEPEPLFQLERRLQAVTEIFTSFKTDPAGHVIAHSDVRTRFLDQSRIEYAINGYVRLGRRH